MNCFTCQKNIVACLEKNLSREESGNIATHLENCRECSAIYDEMKFTFSLIDAEKTIEANPFLVTRVMAAIDNRTISSSAKTVYKRILQTSLIAASIAIATLVGIEAGNLYTTRPKRISVPEEMVYMNDAAMESLNNYTNE
jgi:predicted anti-sigma-YlaC factor YlaD